MALGKVNVDFLKCNKDTYISDYLDVIFVLGSLLVLHKATIVKDHNFSVTGHILTNKPEKVIKLGFN